MNSYTAPVPAQGENMGRPEPRLDGRAKVTGGAAFASDAPVANPAHAFLVTSAIAKGRVLRFDSEAARALPGVIEIVTHENAPKLVSAGFFNTGGYSSSEQVPLSSPDIVHEGQIIGVVLAETYETAREAANRVVIEYEAIPHAAAMRDPGVETLKAADADAMFKDKAVGDFVGAYSGAAVTIDVEYTTPIQHHNAIELFTTTAEWRGDELTLHEPSQFVWSLKAGLAKQLGVDPAKVRVVSPFVGGGFGGKGIISARTAIVASLARMIRRPVKLVATRDQGFTIATYRAETRHRMRLGASADGRLVALGHDAFELTSRVDNFKTAGTAVTTKMYACANVASTVNLVRADRNTPGFMRSPAEVPYMFALESAIDELAEKCGVDPVAFRRLNDTMVDPVTGQRYTSRSLNECFDAASKAFGWEKRDPKPGSMRDGDWLVGHGCATTTYPVNFMPTTARVRLTADGRARVQTAAHEIGQGASTVLAQVAADAFGLAVAAVAIELGDTDLPPGPIAGGSMTTAAAGSSIKLACDRIVERLGGTVPRGDELRAAFEKLGLGSIEEYAEWTPNGWTGTNLLYDGMLGVPPDPSKAPLSHAFGAEFVEVRVHARTREIRVPRVTGAFAAGRIMNPRLARSQLMGGLIWGIGSAIHEATELDAKRGRYVNDNIAEYLVPVNADIGTVEVIFVPEVDAVTPMGVKGLGELGNVGTNAAIANAVYHATGRRIRDLPITIDKLIG